VTVSHLDLRKTTNECHGTKEGFVCLTLRNLRIRYFERLTSPLIKRDVAEYVAFL
jgi:hypothetical protein